MELFSYYKLIEGHQGCTLILYIDSQSSEFARDLISSFRSKTEEFSKNAADSVKAYIDNNLHNVKINTVKIMLGSLLIASFPFAVIYTSSVSAVKPSGNNTTDQNNSLNNQKESIENKNIEAANSSDKKVQNSQAAESKTSGTAANSDNVKVVPSDNLILVNKSHSLSSDYVPKNLVYPNVAATNKAKTMMAKEAALALEAMFKKAKQDNITLYAVSGYRSYSQQKQIFESNTIKSGSADAANKYSARPGQSEHQTGLAMDVSCKSMNFTLEQPFANTPEGKWLKENAAQFGFIIRYTKGKKNITGYQFEPWHIRYVEKTAAMEITKRNITLEEYLAK